jgi:radical S-adenosyl methionine domain-containing protein 2
MEPRTSPAPPVETVNFHVWQPCNMRCAFCFDRFLDVKRAVLPKGHLSRADALAVVRLLAAAGFEKITFAGGEPFLCPWLSDLLAAAKRGGMTTAVVTNGSLLSGSILVQLRGMLDWLVLSIDSGRPATLSATGRATARHTLTPQDYLSLCVEARRIGMYLKINTVVHLANCSEDMSELVIAAQPHRWKIMQVLEIAGQNAGTVEPLLITEVQFDAFVRRHRLVERYGIVLIAERNDDMVGSYAMVDPAGRFFDNTHGRYSYSEPILSCGVRSAIDQVTINREKFLARGGRYPWTIDESVTAGRSV